MSDKKYNFQFKIFLISFVAFLVSVVFIAFYFLLFAQSELGRLASVLAAKSSDAIAIRVIPNPKNYSPLRWYEKQGFIGSPQAITVDGYDAIRDGRTVYVNVSNESGNKLFTNIYLISYNQAAEGATIDIFSQILSHWKFNTNISAVGQCSFSAEIACGLNSECPNNEYCLSPKAKVIRDTKRLADLAEIKIALRDYKDANGYYPRLSAGSYLPNKTVSTWPSWQDSLSKELNTALPIDPINKLGACAGYNPATCWNNETKQFADPTPNNDSFDLPNNSYAYAYKALNNGLGYGLYFQFEYDFTNKPCDGFCSIEKIDNAAPRFTDVNLPKARSGFSYTGFISAVDDNNDYIKWSSAIPKQTWEGAYLWQGVSPALADTGVANTKSIKAQKAGVATADTGGTSYEFDVIIDDGNSGGQTTKTFTIPVINENLPVIQSVDNKSVVIGKNLSFTISAKEADSQYPLSFNVSGLPAGLTGNLNSNQRDYDIGGQVIDTTKDYPITVGAKDYYLGPSKNDVEFKITVKNNPPKIKTVSLPTGAACESYSAAVNANDPDGHSLKYSGSGLPRGLTIDTATGEIRGTIGENISGAINKKDSKKFTPTITVKDEYYSKTRPPYSAESKKQYDLIVEDEVFKVAINPSNYLLYNLPSSINKGRLYHKAVPELRYEGEITANTLNPVVYNLQGKPNWLVVDADNGRVAGGNTSKTGSYNIKAIAANNCGAAYSANLNLEVKKNEWCGDGILQNVNPHDHEDCEGAGGSGAGADDQYACSNNCKWAGGWCGDNIVQDGVMPNTNNYGETCDYGSDKNCCQSCKWICDSSSYQTANLSFVGAPEVILNDGGNANITFPDCRIFDANSGKIDAEIISVAVGTAVVYVTDRSGSMAKGMQEVKNALQNAMEGLYKSAQNGANISVGLVSFSNTLDSHPADSNGELYLYDIGSAVNKDDLKNEIGAYSSAGYTYTKNAVQAAYNALKNSGASNKIIVLLSDGLPTAGYDPANIAKAAKAEGMEIYTIAYTDHLRKSALEIQNIKDDLCGWSSDNGQNCSSGGYSYASGSANDVFSSITKDIVNTPAGKVNININNKISTFQIASDNIDNIPLDLSGISCSNNSQNASFSAFGFGQGKIKFSNLRANYCPACKL